MPYKDKKVQKAYYRQWKANNKDKMASYWIKQRLEALTHYSNGDLKCACCGEREYKFLCLDHIEGGGNKQRKALGSKYILSYLKQAGWPLDYQVLCHNCNMAKGFYGRCPHRIPNELAV